MSPEEKIVAKYPELQPLLPVVAFSPEEVTGISAASTHLLDLITKLEPSESRQEIARLLLTIQRLLLTIAQTGSGGWGS